jgi:hypothetical protein
MFLHEKLKHIITTWEIPGLIHRATTFGQCIFLFKKRFLAKGKVKQSWLKEKKCILA